ncbi:MAG TPA: PEP/pyruvate-binding domain-containing protein [Acidimicrobiales bacterium]|nr:PEP/pyruvate-binding domain-containing protein [Acidimicrobiales bacterium]
MARRRATRRGPGEGVPPGAPAPAIALRNPAARDVALVGAKAANLARAAAAGLPVLPGFAVPVAVVAGAVGAGGFASLEAPQLEALRSAWADLSRDGDRPVVVRSSAVSEDAEGSSMAGRFHSELDVRGWDAFLVALDTVARSAAVVALDGTDHLENHDMAIVVQRFLPAVSGGVLFGADPVSGRTDRVALATVAGGPDALVGGTDGGCQQLLSPRGRVLASDGDLSAAPPPSLRRRLVQLSRRAAAVFGGPQDVEWGVDAAGRLWLFQARPVTALAPAVGTGPIFGPGPVAETFPDPLARLEQELWLVPLRDGLAHALALTGAVSRRALASSPVAVVVGGRAAVDLRLVGGAGEPHGFLRRLDPRPGFRRLRAAWRTGRLRDAFPALAGTLLDTVDRDLAAVPALTTAEDSELVLLLHSARRALVALHGQEVLAGLLLRDAGGAGATGGAALALQALAESREAGVPESRVVVLRPEVLALVPPAIRPLTLPPPAPAVAFAPPVAWAQPTSQEASLREALRLRARWVQELSALCAWELGERLYARDLLARPEQVRDIDLDGLEAALRGQRPEVVPLRPAAPLPAMFRLDPSGRPVAVDSPAERAGQGAGGGRQQGRVVHDVDSIVDGEATVLVTTTLDPSLAMALPAIVGLVAETGSVLSHLAILARELGVATVVGVPGARQRFPVDATVLVDGTSGAVTVLEGDRR